MRARVILLAALLLAGCATSHRTTTCDTEAVTIMDPLGPGVCRGVHYAHTRNVLLACDSGAELLYPWEIMQRYGWGLAPCRDPERSPWPCGHEPGHCAKRSE